jgi:hypothetical protein
MLFAMARPSGVAVRRISRTAGAVLLAAAAVILFASPADRFNPWLFFAFLACFVPGALLVVGLVAWPSRGEAGTSPVRGVRQPPQVPVVATPPSASARVTVLITIMSAAFLALAVLIAICVPASPWDKAAIVFPPLAAAVFFPVYLKRHRRVCVRVDGAGIDARGYVRHVRAGWDEVVLLTCRRVWPMLAADRLYRVRSSRGTFVFFSSWPRADVLANTISRATGLEWHEE